MTDDLITITGNFEMLWLRLLPMSKLTEALTHEIILRIDSNIKQIAASVHMFTKQYEISRKQASTINFFPETPEEIKSLNMYFNELLKLSVLSNAFYFFIRALQDNLYCALLELHDQKWNEHTSTMQKALSKENNFYAQEIIKHINGYSTWFIKTREIRNAIKSGAPTTGGSYNPENGDLEISYIIKKQDKKIFDDSNQINIGPSDLIESINMSSQLINYLQMVAEQTSNNK